MKGLIWTDEDAECPDCYVTAGEIHHEDCEWADGEPYEVVLDAPLIVLYDPTCPPPINQDHETLDWIEEKEALRQQARDEVEDDLLRERQEHLDALQWNGEC